MDLGGRSTDLTLRTQTVLATVNIFDLLTMYGAQYAGRVTQQIRCPVHNDRSPSARVYAQNNKVYCFTCAKSWDVVALVQDKEGLDYPSAIDWLEAHFGVTQDPDRLPDVLRGQLRRKTTVNVEQLYDYVDDALYRNRERLGMLRYTKGCAALDTLKYQLEQKQISGDQFYDQIKAVVRFATQ